MASDNATSFYNGDIARDIIDTINTSEGLNPGNISLSDFLGYIPVERYPIAINYRGYDIYTMNMPSSATTVGLILNILENFDLKSFKHNSAKTLLYLFNAMSLGYADRGMYMGDADFVPVPISGLLDKAYAKSRSLLMNDTVILNRTAAGIPPGLNKDYKFEASIQEESMETTHYTIVDKEGNMVSCTSTIEQTFGNKLVVNGRGFLLNNQLSDFGTGANIIEKERKPRRTAREPDNLTVGGKRPRSSMSPVIILKDKKPLYAFGSPGGSTIITHVTNVIINLIDFEMDINAAVSSPRAFTLNDGKFYIEGSLYTNQELMNELFSMGFSKADIIGSSDYQSGSVNIVGLDPVTKKVNGFSDPRRSFSKASNYWKL